MVEIIIDIVRANDVRQPFVIVNTSLFSSLIYHNLKLISNKKIVYHFKILSSNLLLNKNALFLFGTNFFTGP